MHKNIVTRRVQQNKDTTADENQHILTTIIRVIIYTLTVTRDAHIHKRISEGPMWTK